jgi:hypothetical protein
MMKPRDHDLVTVDPEDVAAARAWNERRAKAARDLAAAEAEHRQLHDTLAHDPAFGELAALETAQQGAAEAEKVADDRDSKAAYADRAAQEFAANQVADLEAAADAASVAFGQALAELLRDAQTTTALTSTVDGLDLRRRYLAGRSSLPPRWDHTTIPFLDHDGDQPIDPQLRLPAVGIGDYTVLSTVLDRLDEDVDAIADLVTAESMHQLVLGNAVRSGAALDIAAAGVVPDDFDVIRTPRRGGVVTHRVQVLCPAVMAPAWTIDETGPGAIADPILSAWVATMLPDPREVGCRVTVAEAGTSQVIGSVDLVAAEIGLDPLGWLRWSADPGELGQRAGILARRHLEAALAEEAWRGRVVLQEAKPPDMTVRFGLDDLLTAASVVRLLLLSSRALTADDLNPATAAPSVPTPRDQEAAKSRVVGLETHVRRVLADLDAQASSQATSGIMDALLAASALGVSAATPQVDEGLPTAATLHSQAGLASAEIRRRLALDPVAAADLDPATVVRLARERLSSLYGQSVLMLLPVDVPTDSAWGPLVGSHPRLAAAERPRLRSWLRSHGRVRVAVDALLAAHDVGEALGLTAHLDLAATQIPAGSDAAWLGASGSAPAGLCSIVAQRVGTVSTTQAVAGLAVDEWTQTTLGGNHSTGIAFHFDQPDSTPPQVALVAVAPDLTEGNEPGTWDLETMVETVTTTMSMARHRAATAESIDQRGVRLRGTP